MTKSTTVDLCIALVSLALSACAVGTDEARNYESPEPEADSGTETGDAAAPPDSTPAQDAAQSPDGESSTDSGAPWDAGPTTDAGAGSCTTGNTAIYVLGKTHELYSFAPDTLTLTQVGMLDCPQGGGTATPFSMAVDRAGTAWVLYNDGHLYHVNTATAACAATNFVPDQHGFDKFGMGFVSNAPGSNEETLYVANEYGIGVIDTGTLVLAPVTGTFGFSAAAELTGTGDARLYGLFYGFPPYISEIDKNDSQLLGEMPLDTVDIGTGFAYAFWGGDFWIFTAPNGTSSRVDRYEPATGFTMTELPSVGFKIVGAGVSTCAPVTRPK